MRFILLFLLIILPLNIFAKQVKNIDIQSKNIPAASIKKLFTIKEGDIFSEEKFEKAKQDLQKMPFFKTLEFIYKEKKDGIDIHIKAEGKSYIMPIFLALSTTKHSAGIALESGNILKHGEKAQLAISTSSDGFKTNTSLSLNKNSFSIAYSQLTFNQIFYQNGWISTPGIFTSSKPNGKRQQVAQIRTKHDTLNFTYSREISNIWSFALTPEYEYYNYAGKVLDSGNHNHINFSLQYADGIASNTDMSSLTQVHRSDKNYILEDLKHIKNAKVVNISYSTGGKWTGADYTLDKLSLQGAYLIEFKKHQRLGLFAKTQKAFKTPFSSEVHSSDLLFGLGIYDKEQLGKAGFSAGISFTYFILRNQTGLLGLMPFYEQAYINSKENSYNIHSGAGLILTYQLWRIGLPMSINYTKNLNDSSHHIGFKIGGHL